VTTPGAGTRKARIQVDPANQGEVGLRRHRHPP
jgi:hypothetical protein